MMIIPHSFKIFFSTTFIALAMLTGCDQFPEENQQAGQDIQINKDTSNSNDDLVQIVSAQDNQNLSHGNMLNIARDITRLEIETGDYIALVRQSQSSLEQAIQDKNLQELQNTTSSLTQELHGLHDALLSLDLKSNEVDQLRQNLLAANQQLLNMPFLYGQSDISKIDFKNIEKQFNTIQMDMVKLVSLVLDDPVEKDTYTNT